MWKTAHPGVAELRLASSSGDDLDKYMQKKCVFALKKQTGYI